MVGRSSFLENWIIVHAVLFRTPHVHAALFRTPACVVGGSGPVAEKQRARRLPSDGLQQHRPPGLFFCQLSVVLVPLGLQMEGNRPKGITVALIAPVGVAVTSLGALSQLTAGG